MPRKALFAVFVSVALAMAVTSVLAAPAVAQQSGTISGRVTDAASGTPIVGAQVLIVGSARRATTGADGTYDLTAPVGTHTMRARAIGYDQVERSVTVTSGGTHTEDFAMNRGALLLTEIVAVGARTARSEVETPVPVDVITSAEIQQSGHTETNELLATVAPSFNASHQTISDGTDHVNPASLRGLGPDQVLVLVNGKRRHSSALVHVNGTFGRGTVGVDLNAIPVSAIERIEILRDGAAAQYGSDAIAGVVNIVLKSNTDFIEVTSQAGITGEGDGGQVKAGINYGFPIGGRGYFNVTGEFLNRERTNRSETWTDDIFPGIAGDGPTNAELSARGLTRDDFTMKTGQSEAIVGGGFFNTSVPLGVDGEFYAFGGVSSRNGIATGFYRLPNSEARVVSEIYPNGFLPEIHTRINDRSINAGARGALSGWDVDFSVSHGGNSFQFNIENTNNASQGAASATTFDAGRLSFNQTVGNLDGVRLINTGGAVRSLSLVLGSEFRLENYRIDAGEEGSYLLGNGGPIPGVDFDTTASGAPKAPGSQVFPGFQPSNEVNRYRNSISAYLGLETQVNDQFLIDVGGRFENYSDFGNTVTGKLAARYSVTPEFAVRGAVSNGFRAPSLHQVWFNNVSIQFVIDPMTGNLEPSRVLTSNNQARVTQAFGIPDLQEETSVNFSGGFTARPVPNFSITADFYHIMIDDRIVLTSRFTDGDPIVAGILAPFASAGVTQAQFFANAVDTRTNGVDVVLQYAAPLGNGTLNLTASANVTKTEVQRINIPPSVAAVFTGGDLEAVRSTIFNREEQNRLEDALPRQKGTLAATYLTDRLSFTARGLYYGSVEYKPTNTDNDESFGAKVLLDVDLAYELVPGVRLSVGANNVFNTFPDRHMLDANLSSGRFPYSRRVTQFGMNGGFYYTRLRLTL